VGKNVLITRPKEQAVELAAFLREQGFLPFIEPIFAVEKMAIPKIERAFSSVIITSINACDALENIGFDPHTKIFTIGKKTEKELRAFGFLNVITSPKNSAESLEKMVAKEEGDILYLRGEKISFDFAARHPNVTEITAYKIQPAENFSPELLNFAPKNIFDEVLLFSSNSAEIFFNLAIKHNLLEYFLASQIFCLSEKIQKRTKELGFEKVANFSEHKFLKKFYE